MFRLSASWQAQATSHGNLLSGLSLLLVRSIIARLIRMPPICIGVDVDMYDVANKELDESRHSGPRVSFLRAGQSLLDDRQIDADCRMI